MSGHGKARRGGALLARGTRVVVNRKRLISRGSDARAGGEKTLKARVFAGAVAICALLLVPQLSAASGASLDRGFGNAGRVSLGTLPSELFRTAPGAGGSVVVLEGHRLVRFLPDGRPDAGFGVNGKVAIPGQLNDFVFQPSDLAVDGFGRILVFGSAVSSNFVGTPPDLTAPISWAAVLRFNSTGSLDSSFGGGQGFVLEDFGLRSSLSTDQPLVRALAGSVDSQARPLLLVGVAEADAPCNGHSGVATLPRAVGRLTASGAPDAGFGNGAVAPVSGRSTPSANLTLVGADAPLVTAATQACPSLALVFRFDAEGTPTSDFGDGGVAGFSAQLNVLGTPSGSLVLQRGKPTNQLIKVTPTGTRDMAFGKGGAVKVSMPAGSRRTMRPVAVDSRGRVILAGGLARFQGGAKRANSQSANLFTVVGRLRPDGRVDKRFGKNGWVLTSVGRGSRVLVYEAALDANGSLVAAVATHRSTGRPGASFLTRYLLGN